MYWQNRSVQTGQQDFRLGNCGVEDIRSEKPLEGGESKTKTSLDISRRTRICEGTEKLNLLNSLVTYCSLL